MPEDQEEGQVKEQKKKEKDKILSKVNANFYTEKNVKDRHQEEIKVAVDRSKIVEKVTYKNGVIKSKIVGVLKKGKVIHNAGLDPKWIKK